MDAETDESGNPKKIEDLCVFRHDVLFVAKDNTGWTVGNNRGVVVDVLLGHDDGMEDGEDGRWWLDAALLHF